MRRLALILAAFAYMVLLIEALRAAAAWWRGETAPAALDYVLIAALPLLVWVWFRYFSMFRKGCAKDVCGLPGRDPDG